MPRHPPRGLDILHEDGLWLPDYLSRQYRLSLEDAGAAVGVARVLQHRVGSHAATATVAARLSLGAGRAECVSGRGRLGRATGAIARAGTGRKGHLLAKVTGHLRYLLDFSLTSLRLNFRSLIGADCRRKLVYASPASSAELAARVRRGRAVLLPSQRGHCPRCPSRRDRWRRRYRVRRRRR